MPTGNFSVKKNLFKENSLCLENVKELFMKHNDYYHSTNISIYTISKLAVLRRHRHFYEHHMLHIQLAKQSIWGDTGYINKVLVLCTQLLLSYLSNLYVYVDFRLTLTISLCRDCTAICKGAIILELRMFGLAPLLRSKLTLSTWFFFVAQCSGVFPEESITFNTRSKERKQNKPKQNHQMFWSHWEKKSTSSMEL